MQTLLQVLRLGLIPYIVGLIFAFACITVSAGATSKWAAGRVGWVLLADLALTLIAFAATTAWFHQRLVGAGHQGGVVLRGTVAFGGLCLATEAVLAVCTLVIFNR